MKTLLHETKIKIGSRYGYVFSNDIYLIYEGRLEDDRNHDDDGKIFLMQESTVLDGTKKDRTEYVEIENGECVLFGNRKMIVNYIGNYSDMGILVDY